MVLYDNSSSSFSFSAPARFPRATVPALSAPISYSVCSLLTCITSIILASLPSVPAVLAFRVFEFRSFLCARGQNDFHLFYSSFSFIQDYLALVSLPVSSSSSVAVIYVQLHQIASRSFPCAVDLNSLLLFVGLRYSLIRRAFFPKNLLLKVSSKAHVRLPFSSLPPHSSYAIHATTFSRAAKGTRSTGTGSRRNGTGQRTALGSRLISSPRGFHVAICTTATTTTTTCA